MSWKKDQGRLLTGLQWKKRLCLGGRVRALPRENPTFAILEFNASSIRYLKCVLFFFFFVLNFTVLLKVLGIVFHEWSHLKVICYLISCLLGGI
ncbi:Hypothetical predicted protein [Olea europaea subsp. europaea]|nr:Hypothetical predicted protein [Olea europaea subsp. europaea]